MYVRSTLKQVAPYDERPQMRGWIVTFEIEVQDSPNFDLPVLIKAADTEERDLIAAAYQRVHEVVAALKEAWPKA